MLRGVVGSFLDSLTEREFDAPLLAVLPAQGFTDIHFIHGGFEFGKDVIAKRTDANGTIRQYSIQSKAGDIGQGDWRSIRPQLEECEYNTRAHPNFDEDLPRVAVLVTTGRLKGSAAVDAQEFRKACEKRGLADFEVWDRYTLLDWLCLDPSLGLTEIGVQDELVALLTSIARRTLTEPNLERHSRQWLAGDDDRHRLARASIETSLICTELVAVRRLDLAALTALHLYRAAWVPPSADAGPATVSDASLRLFASYATELLDQATPLLSSPKHLADTVMDAGFVITYPATCCRLAEVFGLLALLGEPDVSARAADAVATLASDHPGTARPPSDQFAASLVPLVVVLARQDRQAAVQFMRKVSIWLLDRHDADKNGLGLGSLDENEETQFERLVGGATSITTLELRNSSYLASVALDALWVIGAQDLYDALLENLSALRIVASATAADERFARWKRGGGNVFPRTRVDYPRWTDRAGQTPTAHTSAELEALLLGAVCRSRHYPGAMAALTRISSDG
ncbi:hypothetical protein EV649_0444 [Kribbella sp. VKM Ac-2569]|uniref:hypothetical protein n=1 Tax=Kribbella sp. VKM Ac-2569 TaxID=2512220 RepID=UPI00102D19D5|nr:hypothetical protein [Kribbella sp. VKM Ac-2569]RZT26697.1 hypothetical protein EV649_0444 [Kribbella sp. VKM Ac-2569]